MSITKNEASIAASGQEKGQAGNQGSATFHPLDACLHLPPFGVVSSRMCLTVFGAKRERDTTRNGSAITVGSTQNVGGGSCFKPGIKLEK